MESSTQGNLRQRVTNLKTQLAQSRLLKPSAYYIDIVISWATNADPGDFLDNQNKFKVYPVPPFRGRERPSRPRQQQRGNRRPNQKRFVRQVEIIPSVQQVKQIEHTWQPPIVQARQVLQQPVERPPEPAKCKLHPKGNHTDKECRSQQGRNERQVSANFQQPEPGGRRFGQPRYEGNNYDSNYSGRNGYQSRPFQRNWRETDRKGSFRNGWRNSRGRFCPGFSRS